MWQNGLGPPLGHDGQVLFPEPSPPFRQEPLGFDFGGLFPMQKGVFQWIGYRESGKGLEFLPDTASGFERQDVQQSRGFGNDLGPASEPMGKDCGIAARYPEPDVRFKDVIDTAYEKTGNRSWF